MDAFENVRRLIHLGQKLFACRENSVNLDEFRNCKLIKIIEMLAPVVVVMLIYHYLKYNMIIGAYQYEKYVRKKEVYLRKISKKLKHLSKLNGNIYFCYLPISHGTKLPPTYSLFMAIKEVLINSDQPATRTLRTNLLSDLIHTDPVPYKGSISRMDFPDTDFLDPIPNDADPLSDLNLDLMNCSREMIIQAIKDFDIMYTLYRLMDTVSEDSDE